MANTKGNGKSDSVKIFTIWLWQWLLKRKDAHKDTWTHGHMDMCSRPTHTHTHTLTLPHLLSALFAVFTLDMYGCAHLGLLHVPLSCVCVCVCGQGHKPQAKLICLPACRRRFRPTLSEPAYMVLLSARPKHCHVKLKFMANLCDRSVFLSSHLAISWYLVFGFRLFLFPISRHCSVRVRP